MPFIDHCYGLEIRPGYIYGLNYMCLKNHQISFHSTEFPTTEIIYRGHRYVLCKDNSDISNESHKFHVR